MTSIKDRAVVLRKQVRKELQQAYEEQFFLLKEAIEINKQLQKQIAECKRTEKALQESEEKYRSLVDSTDDSIYLVDRDYRYLFMNKKHLSRLGLSENEFLGRFYNELHPTEESEEFIEKVRKVFETGESLQHEHKSHRDGKYFLRTLSPVKDLAGITIAVTVVSKQITERKRMEEELQALSLTDVLTGLYNRRGFLTLAEQQLKTATRLNRRIALLSADLDNLKNINDIYGHHEGDLILIATAKILKSTFRESDIIARIGGDEFFVLMIEGPDNGLDQFSDRLQKNIDLYNTKSLRDYNLSVSMGIIYSLPTYQCSIIELMDQADKLMYENKRLKKGIAC